MTPEPTPWWAARITVSPEGCWLWSLYVNDKGYGRSSRSRAADGTVRRISAHRLAYEQFVGPIPPGLQVDHLCRVRRCVNPAHLEAVTPRTNVLRSSANGGIVAQTGRCVSGLHEMTGENIYHEPRGGRCCRACRQEKARLSYLARKGQRT